MASDLNKLEKELTELKKQKQFVSDEIAEANEAISHYKRLAEEEKYALKDDEGYLVGDDGKRYLPNIAATSLGSWKEELHELKIKDYDLTKRIAKQMDLIKRMKLRAND